MNLVVNFGKKKTYKNINQLDKEDYLLQVVKVRHLMQTQKHSSPRQKVGRVYLNQKWGNYEGGLQRLKNIFSFNSPRKRLILSN
jgi:hypothetical protein